MRMNWSRSWSSSGDGSVSVAHDGGESIAIRLTAPAVSITTTSDAVNDSCFWPADSATSPCVQ